ncbi:MAG: alkaline phosphatase family protein, partial [Planctomycetota bacterium]
MSSRHRLALLLACCLVGSVPSAIAQEVDPSRGEDQRVVIFGIDGADAAMFERLVESGRMPNFEALAKRGSYHRLATTNPAQSPVSWAAFSTGSNPGKTGIFDFLRRDVDVPGKIEISLAGKEWGPPPGVPAGSVRPILPWAGGAAVGLVGLLLATLVLRLVGLDGRRRRVVSAVVGLALAVATGFIMARFLRWVPESVPKAVSYRRGVPMWTVLGQEGVKTVAIEAPISFPADRAENLRLLTGLGTPDVQGHWGFYSVFTEDGKTDDVTPETGGFVDHLTFDDDGVARSRVYGPQDLSLGPGRIREAALEAEDLYKFKVGVPSAKRREERVWQHARRAKHASVVLEVRTGSDGVFVRLGSGGPRPVLDLPVPEDVRGPTVALPRPGDGRVQWGPSVKLKVREWSDRVPFQFRMNPLLSVSGLGRFWLESDGSDGAPFRLILSPVQFDPSDVPPVVELSWPREFAPSLAAKIGAYDTLGWPCLTNPVKDELLTDEAFVAHTRLVLEGRREKLREMLQDPDWRCLFMLFSEVDRVQHAMWRHIDP